MTLTESSQVGGSGGGVAVMPARKHTWMVAVLIILAGAIVYGGSLGYPFIFDDDEVIPENPHIRQLWPLTYSMSAPPQSAVSGRPMVCLSLAVNYWLGGLDPRGYRIFNVLVHVLAALTLFGVIRCTLVRERLSDRFGHIATPVAAIAALMWLLHPLQTESVTYVVQRSESMMGLFYLLMLYCAIRSWDSQRPLGWQVAAVAASALGMATKEVMVTAPLMVLLYDAFFRSGSIRRALRSRVGLYAGLAASWGVLAAVMLTGPRSETVGFSHGVTALQYGANQCIAVVGYIRLALWPHPLILDYGFPRDVPFREWAPYAAVLAGVLAATVAALAKRPRLGFAGLWFFLILAPTSSLVPIASEVAADRRMYLPLAGTCVLAVIAGQWLWSRACHALGLRFAARSLVAVMPTAAVLVALAILTVHRNEDYRSPLAMWSDNVSKRPENPRARNNLAKQLYIQGDVEQAMKHIRRAIELRPDHSDAHNNLGAFLAGEGDYLEAIEQYRTALAIRPEWAEAHQNMGLALAACGRLQEAVASYRRAIEIRPSYPEARYNMGNALLRLGRATDAVEQYGGAIQENPEYFEAHFNLAAVLRNQGDAGSAAVHQGLAMRLALKQADELRHQGRVAEAATVHGKAVQMDPNSDEAHYLLGRDLLDLGRVSEAVGAFSRALQINPDNAAAKSGLETALKSSSVRQPDQTH